MILKIKTLLLLLALTVAALGQDYQERYIYKNQTDNPCWTGVEDELNLIISVEG